jgi:hypothetical protein
MKTVENAVGHITPLQILKSLVNLIKHTEAKQLNWICTSRTPGNRNFNCKYGKYVVELENGTLHLGHGDAINVFTLVFAGKFVAVSYHPDTIYASKMMNIVNVEFSFHDLIDVSLPHDHSTLVVSELLKHYATFLYNIVDDQVATPSIEDFLNTKI